MLYSIVIDGLGRQVVDSGVWSALSLAFAFGGGSAVNSAVFKNTPITDDKANAIYNDPYYGLSNKDNYAKWDSLLVTADPLIKR